MKILIVIPCYHEEEVLPLTMEKMQVVIGRLKDELQVEGRILFVDDGSKDRTWQIISALIFQRRLNHFRNLKDSDRE